MIVIALLIPFLALTKLASGQEARLTLPPKCELSATSPAQQNAFPSADKIPSPQRGRPVPLHDRALDSLRNDYEQRLVATPGDADILIALAIIAERQQRWRDAERFRRQARLANPESPLVMANTMARSTTQEARRQTENDLKAWIAEHPEAAALHFAQGNFLARQGRWSEAEGAYFNAVAYEGDNPDFLFNLAVSLDHLRQYHQASQQYRLAIEAAGKRPAGFDTKQVIERIGILDSSKVSQP